MKNLLIIFLSLTASFLFGQSPVGIWKTIDDESGKAKSHVQLYESNGRLYGKVIKLLDPNSRTTCEKCPGKDKDRPIVGMQIMNGLVKKGKEWTDGDVVDPANGKAYSCTVWFEEGKPDQLKLRGYIGISLLGRTQTWHRVK